MRDKNWDIFCHVVDNFGDIGVCWRLARQLAAEHGVAVRLWVDDLDSLRRVCPEVQASPAEQRQFGVLVCRWDAPFPATEVADVVIEAFACELPDGYLAAMAARLHAPVWINLEYLSAEEWIGSYHGLASPHPRLGLRKYFFFPGFVSASGGLLREAGLIERRQSWQAEPEAAWRKLGLPAAASGETSVSLFCYENPALPELLHAWISGNARVRCLIPEGKALSQAAASLGHSPLHVGNVLRQGNLTVYALPFLSQDEYDHLLWSCDLNFVRGEDSFVRAQWAARPMVWHIYPQESATHITKLEAFLGLYCQTLGPADSAACHDFWMSWNGAAGDSIATAWSRFWQAQAELKALSTRWTQRLCGQLDLAHQLVRFSENLL